MSEQDEELKEAWRTFCEKLSDAGNSIIDSKTLGSDTDDTGVVLPLNVF